MPKFIPLLQGILRQWLKCGYLESSTFHETDQGTPQGGIILPILCNIALDGLQDIVLVLDKKRLHLNVVLYADDFVVTGVSPDYLQNEIVPDLQLHLNACGLELSEEKTKLSHIDRGFNFLGFSVRKYNGNLLIRPQDGKLAALLARFVSNWASYTDYRSMSLS